MFLRRHHTSAGFTLLEPLLAGALLSLTALAVVTGLVAGQRSNAAVGERVRAMFLAQEGIEVVRNMRDESITELAAGTWGLSVQGGVWALVPTSDTTDDYYTRTITIAAPETDEREVTVRVSWETETGERDIELQSLLTDWR